MNKIVKRKVHQVTAFLLTVAMLFGAINYTMPSARAESQGPANGTSHNHTPADVTKDGVTLHKEITDSRGSQATGDLEYDIKLGVKIDPGSQIAVAPMDIAMVLDRSSSMAGGFANDLDTPDIWGDTVWVPVKPADVNMFPGAGDLKDHLIYENTYYYKNVCYVVKREEGYKKVTPKIGLWGPTSQWRVEGEEDPAPLISPTDEGVNQFYVQASARTDSRLNGLKDAANSFVDAVKGKCPDSRMGVISYSSAQKHGGWSAPEIVTNETEESEGTRDLVKVTDEKIHTSINGITALGDTYTASGLAEAYATLTADVNASDHEKFVILFTDGSPTDFCKNSVEQANLLKKAGATIFTVGTFDDENDDIIEGTTPVMTIEEFMEEIASENRNGQGKYYYRADNPDQLKETFLELMEEISIIVEKKIEDAKVRDYIDDRFELTDESIENLEAQGVTVGTDSEGRQYVEWTGTISSEDGMKTFTGITVTPKDRTLSGENLPTNIEGDSALYKSDDSLVLSFPMPTVEIAKTNILQVDKTAVVHGDNPNDIQNPENPDRMFDIDLNVWADQAVGGAEPRDIMLILDRSGSMDDEIDVVVAKSDADLETLDKSKTYLWYHNRKNREVSYREKEGKWCYRDGRKDIEAKPTEENPFFVIKEKIELLKENAVEFVNQVAEVSPESRIGIILFSSGRNNVKKAGFTALNQKDDLINIIQGINECSGYTETFKALEMAEEEFADTNTGYGKVALLFTDGEPQSEDHSDNKSAKMTIEQAKLLKNAGVDIFTLGLGLDHSKNLGSYQPEGGTPIKLTPVNLMEYVASEPKETYCHTADNAQELYDAFQQILTSLSNEVSPVIVRDYIDRRFEVVDPATGNPLKEGDAVGTDGVLRYNKLMDAFYVEWKDQSVPVRTEETQGSGWHRKITVKAVEDFFGGNDIPTNLPSSAVYLQGDGGEEILMKEFPIPTVNVPVRFTVNRGEEIVFKGNPVKGTDLPKKMFDKEKVTYTDKDGKTVEFSSVETGTFQYQWFDGDGVPLTEPSDSGEFPEGQYPQSRTYYTLKVTFVPEPNDPEKESNGRPVENTVAQDRYWVTLETGSIEVNKQIHKGQTYYVHGDPIFVFCLQKLNKDGQVESSQLRSVRFSEDDPGENMGKNSQKSALFDGLSVGTYRVIELDTLRYQFEAFGDASSNATLDQENQWMTFQVGPNSPEGTVLKDSMGTFINNKVLDRYFTHTDVQNNDFTIGEEPE